MNEVAELHRISVIYVLSFLLSGETPPRPGRGAQGPEPPSAPEECTEDHPISPHQTPSRGPGMSVCAHWRSWIVFPSVLLRCFNEQHPKSRKEIKRSRKQLTCALCVLVAGREAGLEWGFCRVFEFRHWAGGAEQAATEESGTSQLFSERSPCRRGPEWVSECVAP